ncbi:MAG: hypothetical protein WC488_02795 [Candidatus Micrarchaeia archaeon]
MKQLFLVLILAASASASPAGIPPSLFPCLEQCCDSYSGTFDSATGYCDTDYDTSVSPGFSSCQYQCNIGSMGSGAGNTPGSGSAAGSQYDPASMCCVPAFILLAVLGLALKN